MTNQNNPQEVQKKAAEMMLQVGIKIPIPAPYILRIFGKKEIKLTIKRFYLGTLLQISILADSFTMEPEQVNDSNRALFIHQNSKTITTICALAFLNHPFKNKLKSILAHYLKWHLTADELYELTLWIVGFTRTQSFINSISLAKKMTMTAKMSPTEKRSQEED